jgi:hypothetical protein
MNTVSVNLGMIAGQGELLEPEVFQAGLIAGMTRALLRPAQPPCLLRAPTGSGKTFMLARVLANVSAEVDTLWFWFVPFVNLVGQTLDALTSNAGDLSPIELGKARGQEPQGGDVLIGTAQSVARATWRKQGYDADGDDTVRTLARLVKLARARALRIGLVVDEAHIALDKTTEFGQFAQWLNPDFLLMATATPKDQRLLDFLASAGRSGFESFAVSRDDVVAARLNKRYIEAVIYDLRHSVRTLADLKSTVLRQAWKCHTRLKRELAQAGIPLTPLLLVQVGNGEDTVGEAERVLIELCRVHPALIGKHSADAPDPVLMGAIANDMRKEVLIFKQSAGTGFDAPRAFVLASTKLVNDPDFAMQFIGRIMRVASAIRRHYPRPQRPPGEFDTAYVYLADAEAQRGFETAVRATEQVKTQLEGQTEKLVMRETPDGTTVISNKPDTQDSLSYAWALPLREDDRVAEPKALDTTRPTPTDGPQRDLFAGLAPDSDPLDVYKPGAKSRDIASSQPEARTPEAIDAALAERGIRLYTLRKDLPGLRTALKREQRPEMADMTALSRAVAAKLELSPGLRREAIQAALNRLRETEHHTELTTQRRHDEKVLIVTDRSALSRRAWQALRALPQVEDEDCRVILEVLAQRMLPELESHLDEIDQIETLEPAALRLLARDAACWIATASAETLAEGMYEAIAEQAVSIDAAPLPDAMVFPADLPLLASRKNLYGVYPPDKDALAQVEQVLLSEQRRWLTVAVWPLENGEIFRAGQFDANTALNGEELSFIESLDRAEFVVWWHRNPDRKPYSVSLVRGESRYQFHPDFVVCLEHFPGDEPLQRLIETKHDVKDAARKARHVPDFYGRVLFLTRDGSRLCWVREDGTLGNAVDLDHPEELRDWMRRTRPLAR